MTMTFFSFSTKEQLCVGGGRGLRLFLRTQAGVELLDPLVEELLFSLENNYRVIDKAHCKPLG